VLFSLREELLKDYQSFKDIRPINALLAEKYTLTQ
jgi:hypothetical protein